jgi:hypothetical protein
LSDEDVVNAWVENPCWQFFSGMQFFSRQAPIDSSSMTRWCSRLGALEWRCDELWQVAGVGRVFLALFPRLARGVFFAGVPPTRLFGRAFSASTIGGCIRPAMRMRPPPPRSPCPPASPLSMRPEN